MAAINMRKLHSSLAPIFAMPLLLTVLTGSLFQIAATTGNADSYLWLLELHRGKFGRINLESIYPFLNAFGLFLLLLTGISMWLKTRPSRRKR